MTSAILGLIPQAIVPVASSVESKKMYFSFPKRNSLNGFVFFLVVFPAAAFSAVHRAGTHPGGSSAP